MNYFKKNLGLLFVPAIFLALSNTNINTNTNDYIPSKHNSNNIALQTSDTVSMPKYEYIKYNVAVQYEWKVGDGGDTLYVGNYAYMRDVHSTTYSEIKWSRAVGYRNCDALAYMAKSYNYSTETFSDTYNLEKNINGTIRYGEDCRCRPLFLFDSAHIYTDSIPTSFDKDNFVWKHNRSSGDYIEATLQYGIGDNAVITDLEVKIPALGTRKTSVMLNGVTFELRTGPNKCSLRTTSNNISPRDIYFGFGYDIKSIYD